MGRASSVSGVLSGALIVQHVEDSLEEHADRIPTGIHIGVLNGDHSLQHEVCEPHPRACRVSDRCLYVFKPVLRQLLGGLLEQVLVVRCICDSLGSAQQPVHPPTLLHQDVYRPGARLLHGPCQQEYDVVWEMAKCTKHICAEEVHDIIQVLVIQRLEGFVLAEGVTDRDRNASDIRIRK